MEGRGPADQGFLARAPPARPAEAGELVDCPANVAGEEGTLIADRTAAHAPRVPRLSPLLAAILVLGCGRGAPPDPAPTPGLAWDGSWPVLALSDPALSEHLVPLDAHAAVWLTPPDHAEARGWMDPGEVAVAFAGEASSARIGRARAHIGAARALDAVAQLDAEALCALGQRQEAYGDEVPEGYLFGVEGCLWAGDADGAARAWELWTARSADGPVELSAWPGPPEGPGAPGARRDLPVSGFDGGTGRAGVAYSRIYRSRGQEVEFAFVLPADLAATAEVLRGQASSALEGCRGCLDGAGEWLERPRRTPAGLCSLDAAAALPLLIGTGALRADHACPTGDDRPPTWSEGADVASLDDALARYVEQFVDSVEREAVPAGTLPREALPTLRAMVERAVVREMGLDAHAAGDAAVALWALGVAGGTDDTPRGARDPELLCTLSLVRFRAGTHRPVIRTLDAASALAGWESLGPVARAVARVEALPGAGVQGVMR